MRIRLIPIAIFVAAMLFTVKLGEIWQTIEGVAGDPTSVPVQVAPVIAQEDSQAPAETEPEPELGNAPAIDPGAEEAEPEIDEELLRDLEADGERHSVERRLSQELAERRKLLDQRARQLDEREALITAAEQKLIAKQQQLERLRDRIKKLVEAYEEAEKEENRKLVAIYSAMKAKAAAAIFDDLELETLITVARGMSARKLAPVLAAMNPEKARIVTQELNAQEELPSLPN